MVEILEIEEKKKKELCLEYKLEDGPHTYAKGVYDKDELLGCCIYKQEQDKMGLLYADDLPMEIFDGLIRAVLNTGISHQAETAEISINMNVDKLMSLHFITDLDNLTIKLTNFFSQCKKC